MHIMLVVCACLQARTALSRCVCVHVCIFSYVTCTRAQFTVDLLHWQLVCDSYTCIQIHISHILGLVLKQTAEAHVKSCNRHTLYSTSPTPTITPSTAAHDNTCSVEIRMIVLTPIIVKSANLSSSSSACCVEAEI